MRAICTCSQCVLVRMNLVMTKLIEESWRLNSKASENVILKGLKFHSSGELRTFFIPPLWQDGKTSFWEGQLSDSLVMNIGQRKLLTSKDEISSRWLLVHLFTSLKLFESFHINQVHVKKMYNLWKSGDCGFLWELNVWSDLKNHKELALKRMKSCDNCLLQ